MSPTEASNITQALPQQVPQKTATPLRKELVAADTAVNTPLTVIKQENSADTVSISSKSAQIFADANNDSAKKKTAHKLTPDISNAKIIGDVQFAYNFKGDLLVRFMDRNNRLIYQIPPELLSRVEAGMSQPNTSVDKKA